MSTDHVTQDVVRVGQELVVKNVSKMYIAEHLNQIKFRRFKHKYKVSALLFFLACVSGNFGEDCKSICGKCLVKDDCFHTNGTCLNGCSRGYQGPLCKTRKYIIMKQDFFYLIKTLYQRLCKKQIKIFYIRLGCDTKLFAATDISKYTE